MAATRVPAAPDTGPVDLSAVLHGSGRKLTPQRDCVFAVLRAGAGHATAADIHVEARRRMPTISLKTVYDVLHELVAVGVVSAVELGDHATRFEVRSSPHDHLVCTGCGQVEDVEVDLAGTAERWAHGHGMRVTEVQVLLRGLCRSCSG